MRTRSRGWPVCEGHASVSIDPGLGQLLGWPGSPVQWLRSEVIVCPRASLKPIFPRRATHPVFSRPLASLRRICCARHAPKIAPLPDDESSRLSYRQWKLHHRAIDCMRHTRSWTFSRISKANPSNIPPLISPGREMPCRGPGSPTGGPGLDIGGRHPSIYRTSDRR